MTTPSEAPIVDENPKQLTSPPPLKALPEHAEKTSKGGIAWWVWLLLLVFVAGAVYAALRHVSKGKEAEEASADTAIPTVLVAKPKMGQPDYDLTLPGNVQPYSTTPIYARTDGYLQRWLVDIGAPVKQGQLLAEIESPEVDQQLNQAVGGLQQAQANLKLAQVTADRWKEMLQGNTVSRQDADQKQGDLDASKANVTAAAANVARLQNLKQFQQVVAPFDGIVTERNVEVGNLISSTVTATQKPLFQIADDHILRTYINVPETQAAQISIGQPAKVVLSSHPADPIMGKVVRTANALDMQSRTLLVEIQIDNSNHKLLSGGYAIIHLPIHQEAPSLILPVNALLFRPEGTQAGVVSADGTVALKTLKIGKDFGTKVEVIGGLTADDQVIINPSDSLQNGDKVHTKPAEEPKKS
jgi:RND family efflux transporter MFP subunit